MRWWEQEVIALEGIRDAVEVVAEQEGVEE